jgi:leucyl aminopeptidase (aminopeptidase T)
MMAGWLQSIAQMWYQAQAAADTSLSDTLTGAGDKCHLYRDALDETVRQADAIMARMAEQLEALYQCRLTENPEGTFDADNKTSRMILQVQRQGQLAIEAFKTTAIVLRQKQQQAASE